MTNHDSDNRLLHEAMGECWHDEKLKPVDYNKKWDEITYRCSKCNYSQKYYPGLYTRPDYFTDTGWYILFKALMSGKFKRDMKVTCWECNGNRSCSTCHGSGKVKVKGFGSRDFRVWALDTWEYEVDEDFFPCDFIGPNLAEAMVRFIKERNRTRKSPWFLDMD
jgi:hypothetical protein